MIIRFIGLICHVYDGGKAFAVLVNAPLHRSRFIVPIRDTVGGDTSSNLNTCFSISGRAVSFSPSGPVDRTGLLGVPDLKLIGASTAALHANVKSQTPVIGRFESFVLLPEGKYGIEDYFETKATFNGTDYLCIPRTVTLTTTGSATFVVSGLPTALSLKPTATVTITNLENPPLPSSHFHLYGNLFDPPASITPPTEDPNRLCAEGTQPFIPTCPREEEQSVTVECSNSQFP